MGKSKPFGEIFIGLMILLGLVLVFLEDISRLGGWSVGGRTTLVVLGFLVDLVFSVEFVVRSVMTGRRKTWKAWFGKERGWIDLLSSWPLLLFSSGPLMWSMLSGGAGGTGFMSMMGLLRTARVFRMSRVLRVFRVLRVLRVLRFLRLLRILKFVGVQKALVEAQEKEQASEEVRENPKGLEAKASIMVLVILSFVAVLMISPLMPKLFFTPDQPLADQQKTYMAVLQDWYQSMSQGDLLRLEALRSRLEDDPEVLFLYSGAVQLVGKLSVEEPPWVYLPKKWFYADYKIVPYQNLRLYYSTRKAERMSAKVNLLLETLVVIQVLILMLLYKPEKN